MLVKLIHPKHGLCAQEVVLKNTKNIKEKWKFRYGKKYDECTIVVESRYTNIDSRKIINIKTGEEYLTKEDAAKDLGVSKETITKHLNRRLKQENSHLYLVKWQL